jgi:hypothetical protein
VKLFFWLGGVSDPVKGNHVKSGVKADRMQKFRVIHGYNNGDVKWCVVCVDSGIQDAPICSQIFDSKAEAEMAIDELLHLQSRAGTTA